MLVFLQKHEFDWQIPSQIVFSDDHMKTSPGHCGHFGHRDAWFQWDKSMISAKRVLWKIFECRVCQFSRPPRLWIDTRPSRMAIYVQMAIPNSISHTNSIRKRIPDRFSDFSVIAISLQYWSCLPYLCIFWTTMSRVVVREQLAGTSGWHVVTGLPRYTAGFVQWTAWIDTVGRINIATI